MTRRSRSESRFTMQDHIFFFIFLTGFFVNLPVSSLSFRFARAFAHPELITAPSSNPLGVERARADLVQHPEPPLQRFNSNSPVGSALPVLFSVPNFEGITRVGSGVILSQLGVQCNRPYTPIYRCSPNKPDYQWGLPLDPTAPIRHDGKDLDRRRRGRLGPCEPWKLTAIPQGMWPRVSLDHTGPRKPLPSQNRLVPVLSHFVINARNPSAEWDLTSSHHHVPSTAYVEGDLDRVCKSRLDIIRELDGYQENQLVLLLPVGPIGPDPRLFEPALL
ncbi:hypothetical protein CRG98_017854 [Punica granatum]|uniref:Uncharacterized protein n=1 Tax=Punica granatum TaxID=22663 RepID=A0A2I0JZQ2_PUNGR|nr:hypothetical protein CRG98_017854 [Punica granatum]